MDEGLVNKQEIVHNLSKQTVMAGRVFDMNIVNQPRMDSLHDIVEIQSGMHLFDFMSSVLYEEEVCEFYYNISFQEDGSIRTRVKNIIVHLDEDLRGTILGVPRRGIRFVVGKVCSVDFVKICSKLPTTRCAGLFKKL